MAYLDVGGRFGEEVIPSRVGFSGLSISFQHRTHEFA
jgi:hypothetical protein